MISAMGIIGHLSVYLLPLIRDLFFFQSDGRRASKSSSQLITSTKTFIAYSDIKVNAYTAYINLKVSYVNRDQCQDEKDAIQASLRHL